MQPRKSDCAEGRAAASSHLQAEDVAPHAALFIDDIEQNVDGAKHAGLQALHFIDVQALTEALEHLLPVRQ